MFASLKARQTRQITVVQLIPVLAATFVVALYMTYGINRSLWLDEANTVLIAKGSPKQIIDGLARDVSPPLYYFLLSAWMGLFGSSEIALRLPSIFFYLAGIWVVWLVGRMLLGPQGGGVASFIYAVNPIVGRQAQNARMYSMLALLVALSLMIFVILVRENQRRTPGLFALFGLVAFLGLNTHYWFAFVLIAYGSWVLCTWRSWSVRDLGLLGGFTVTPFLVINLRMFLQQSLLPATSWTPRPEAFDLARFIGANIGLISLRYFRAIAAVLSLPILWSLLTRRCNWRRLEPRTVLFLGFIGGISLLTPFLISMKRPIFWLGRYDVIAVPFFALLIASLLLPLPEKPRLLFQLIVAGLCAAYFLRAVHGSRDTNWLNTLDPAPLGDRAAALTICAESVPGDFVIYTGLSRAAVSFYVQRFKCSDKLKQVSYPAEFEQHMGWEDPRRNYSQEPPLNQEAESVVASAYASGARIFLLFNEDVRLSSGIVNAIERRFQRASSRKFVSCSWCFSEMRVYSKLR